jgi:hypothetical protein
MSSATSAPVAASAVDQHARLTRFYGKYNPGKLDTVTATVAKYDGKEATLYNSLVKKYGPEPEAPSSVPANDNDDTAAAAGWSAVDHRAWLTRFFEKYNPSKVDTVAGTINEYEGKEEALFTAVVGQYGAEPGTPVAAETVTAAEEAPATTEARAAGPADAPVEQTARSLAVDESIAIVDDNSAIDHHARLTRFYEKYNPEKLDTVAGTLQKYAGREETLFTALVGKYGAEVRRPSTAPPSPTCASSSAASRWRAPTCGSRTARCSRRPARSRSAASMTSSRGSLRRRRWRRRRPGGRARCCAASSPTSRPASSRATAASTTTSTTWTICCSASESSPPSRTVPAVH